VSDPQWKATVIVTNPLSSMLTLAGAYEGSISSIISICHFVRGRRTRCQKLALSHGLSYRQCRCAAHGCGPSRLCDPVSRVFKRNFDGSSLPGHTCKSLLNRLRYPKDPVTNSFQNVQTLLCYRYPVQRREDHTSLPTCPYRWPNGQGDVAKFLEGRENSDLWEKQFGSLYRIWSGTTPEV